MMGANTYIHTSDILAVNNAGAIERAGFMEAPVIGPANTRAKVPMNSATYLFIVSLVVEFSSKNSWFGIEFL